MRSSRLLSQVVLMTVCLCATASRCALSATPLFDGLEAGRWPRGWVVDGEAFAAGPSAGRIVPQEDIDGK